MITLSEIGKKILRKGYKKSPSKEGKIVFKNKVSPKYEKLINFYLTDKIKSLFDRLTVIISQNEKIEKRSNKTKEDKYWNNILSPTRILGAHSFKNKLIIIYFGSIKKEFKEVKPDDTLDNTVVSVFFHEFGHFIDRKSSTTTPFDEIIADKLAKKYYKKYNKWWSSY